MKDTGTAYTELPPLGVLLTVNEAARIRRCSERFIRAQLAAGVIQGSKLGGQWRVARDPFLKQCGLERRELA